MTSDGTSDETFRLIHAAGGIGGARLILSIRKAAAQPPSLPVIDSLVDAAITGNFGQRALGAGRKATVPSLASSSSVAGDNSTVESV